MFFNFEQKLPATKAKTKRADADQTAQKQSDQGLPFAFLTTILCVPALIANTLRTEREKSSKI